MVIIIAVLVAAFAAMLVAAAVLAASSSRPRGGIAINDSLVSQAALGIIKSTFFMDRL